MRADCLRLICEPHSLRFFSPLSRVVLGLFPRSRERGSLRGGLRVVGASGLLLAGRARRLCFLPPVSLEVLTFAFASSCLKFDEN